MNRRESWVRSILLFAVGFVATSKLIDRILPYDLDPLLHAKMTHFQRHKDEYTTLFIGDSRIYRELVPTQFDAALRSAGVESESFNLALLAMSIPEAHFLLERVAALRPKRLKYVIVGSRMDTARKIGFRGSAWRDIYWRTLEETGGIIATHLAGKQSRGEAPFSIVEAVTTFVYRFANKGRIPLIIDERLKPSPHPDWDMDRLRGYFPLELENQEPFITKREKFVKAGLRGLSLPSNREVRTPISPHSPKGRLLSSIRILAEENHWRIAFVGSIRQWPVADVCAGSADCAMLDFDDKVRFRDLYRPDRLYDFGHLNRQSAERYTEIVAGRLLALAGFLDMP